MRVWSGKGAAAQTYSALFQRWRSLFFLPRLVAPGSEQAPCRYEVWLLQLAGRLLVDRLVVVRHLTPLTQTMRLLYLSTGGSVESRIFISRHLHYCCATIHLPFCLHQRV
jgi:hypothetical protein